MASSKPLLHVPYAYVMAITFSLPVVSLCTCLLLGIVLHLDVSTRTHCKVPNIVPSVSAVIGGNTPERYIWRMGMAFFSFPRVLDAFLYHNFFSASPGGGQPVNIVLNGVVWVLHVGQYLSLFTLSYVSSTEYYVLHRNGFIGFISCSIIHMLFFLLLFTRARSPFSLRDRKSFRLRVLFTSLHIFLFITSIYFYKRHNDYCEPYMYSWYSACEYLVVLTNIGFHTAEAVDFGSDHYFSLAPPDTVKHS